MVEREGKINKSLDELVNEDKKFSKRRGGRDDRDDRSDRRPQYQRRDRSRSTDRRRGHSPVSGAKVFVSNLSYDTNWRSLKDHMRQAGEVLRADVFEDDRGRSRGLGVVEFRSSADAQRAIRDLHQSTLDGRMIFIREDEEPNAARGQGQGGANGTQRRQRRSRSRSLSIQRKQHDTRSEDKSRGRQIYIGNLPYSVTKGQLREAFKDFGNVIFTEVPQDDRGRSKGYGLLTFENKKDAEEAIRVMDQAKFNDRVVNVKWDTKM